MANLESGAGSEDGAIADMEKWYVNLSDLMILQHISMFIFSQNEPYLASPTTPRLYQLLIPAIEGKSIIGLFST